MTNGAAKWIASVASEVTRPYSGLEALIYDTVVGSAAATLVDRATRELLDEVPAGGSVLDVGCGGGQMAIALAARRPDVLVSAIDLSEGQIVRARRRAEAHHVAPRTRFACADACALPFGDDRFDLVTSCGVIKHWAHKDRALAECVRVLKPGGALLVVELDRGCREDDARRFVAGWHLLPGTAPVALRLFRRIGTGRSVDLEEVRALAATTALEALEVARVPGCPALFLRGRKPLRTSARAAT